MSFRSTDTPRYKGFCVIGCSWRKEKPAALCSTEHFRTDKHREHAESAKDRKWIATTLEGVQANIEKAKEQTGKTGGHIAKTDGHTTGKTGGKIGKTGGAVSSASIMSRAKLLCGTQGESGKIDW